MREGLHSPLRTSVTPGTLWLAFFCSFGDSVFPPPGKLPTNGHLNINLQLPNLACDITTLCGGEAQRASLLSCVAHFGSPKDLQQSRILAFSPPQPLCSANQNEMSPFIFHTDN